MAENIKKFLTSWSKVVLREAIRIAERDRSEVEEINGRYLKEKFSEASRI